MRSILHILTRPGDAFAVEIMANQQKEPQNEIIVTDLTQPEADYKELLENIFAVESVQVW